MSGDEVEDKKERIFNRENGLDFENINLTFSLNFLIRAI